MTTIACPICSGPVDLVTPQPACLIGHDFGPEELQHHLTREASRALWSAVRALEDSVSGARWRMTLPDPPANLQRTIERISQEAQVLRDLMEVREDSGTDAHTRPDRW